MKNSALNKVLDSVKTLSYLELIELIKKNKNFSLIDVRNESEKIKGVIPYSITYGDDVLEAKVIDQMEFDSKIIIYCQSGYRSKIVANSLTSLGYKYVYSLNGGVNEWIAKGNELIEYQTLSLPEKLRYSRQSILKEVGINGQLALKKSRVLVVGLGGLGVPCSTYLVASGVGEIGLIDHDSVDVTNLHRQVIYSEEDIGKKKVNAAKNRLSKLNSFVKINTYIEKIGEHNSEDIISKYDVVVDCTDAFSARYAINKACLKLSKPFVQVRDMQ